jgi:hypothetical protein
VLKRETHEPLSQSVLKSEKHLLFISVPEREAHESLPIRAGRETQDAFFLTVLEGGHEGLLSLPGSERVRVRVGA